MLKRLSLPEPDALGQGVYGAAESLRLLNFSREPVRVERKLSRQTLSRWLRGYDFRAGDGVGHSDPLWLPDYANDDDLLELSFRDLIELRFVKAFRDLGLSLPTIRECFRRAVEEVGDERPFSTRRFQTDGKTIFLDITHNVREGELIDLKGRQGVFRSVVEPSLRDLEFDADVVARWFPLGARRRSIVVDPTRAFGRPITAEAGVPTKVLVHAVSIEGSPERVARLYEVSGKAVRDAIRFERALAA